MFVDNYFWCGYRDIILILLFFVFQQLLTALKMTAPFTSVQSYVGSNQKQIVFKWPNDHMR